MAIATITISDKGDDDLDVRVVFGQGGIDQDSPAHHLAIAALGFITDQHSGADRPPVAVEIRPSGEPA